MNRFKTTARDMEDQRDATTQALVAFAKSIPDPSIEANNLEIVATQLDSYGEARALFDRGDYDSAQAKLSLVPNSASLDHPKSSDVKWYLGDGWFPRLGLPFLGSIALTGILVAGVEGAYNYVESVKAENNALVSLEAQEDGFVGAEVYGDKLLYPELTPILLNIGSCSIQAYAKEMNTSEGPDILTYRFTSSEEGVLNFSSASELQRIVGGEPCEELVLQ